MKPTELEHLRKDITGDESWQKLAQRSTATGPSFMENWDGSTVDNSSILIWKTSNQCKKCGGIRITGFTMTGGNLDCEHKFLQDKDGDV